MSVTLVCCETHKVCARANANIAISDTSDAHDRIERAQDVNFSSPAQFERQLFSQV